MDREEGKLLWLTVENQTSSNNEEVSCNGWSSSLSRIVMFDVGDGCVVAVMLLEKDLACNIFSMSEKEKIF